MTNPSGPNATLELVAQVLIRCFFMLMAALLIWWMTLMLAGDLVYRVHCSMLALTREQFDAIHYGGMLITKTAMAVFFLFPYVGIRLVLRKQRS